VTSVPQTHRDLAPDGIRCAIVTVSDTRTLADDQGGQMAVDLLTAAGHVLVDRAIVKDEPRRMRSLIRHLIASSSPDAILLTGGTGISRRDQTMETVSGLLTKSLPGYGELFRRLSYDEIGPAAMLSRAVGGLLDSTVVLTMPGSPAAVRLAMEKIILPELGHLVQQARR
jgi:molybdenum cofactor biosynthesis protein B